MYARALSCYNVNGDDKLTALYQLQIYEFLFSESKLMTLILLLLSDQGD